MKNIEEKINNLIIDLNLTVPISVEDIAQRHGIHVKRAPAKGVSGLLYRKGDNAYIAINSKESNLRQRFTIAHELGHYFLHPNDNTFIEYIDFRDNKENVSRSRREIEANQFAAGLLIPRILIEKDVSALKVDNISENEISLLADKYQVTEKAMTYRLINLKLSKTS